MPPSTFSANFNHLTYDSIETKEIWVIDLFQQKHEGKKLCKKNSNTDKKEIRP